MGSVSQNYELSYEYGDAPPKVGASIFQNAYGHGANVVTAGQKDYQMRMMQIKKTTRGLLPQAGHAPGSAQDEGRHGRSREHARGLQYCHQGVGRPLCARRLETTPQTQHCTPTRKNANGLIQLYMVSIMNTNARAYGMCT